MAVDTEHPQAPPAPRTRTSFLHRQKVPPVLEETQGERYPESEEPVVRGIHFSSSLTSLLCKFYLGSLYTLCRLPAS
jgi:hypothetical protein